MFHDVFEKDLLIESNLRKAPKLNQKVLHPGNNKQSVPLALAIFDETTAAAIQSYFPEKSDAIEFLKLFKQWWVLSNSKSRFNTRNYLGNAAVLDDTKPCMNYKLATTKFIRREKFTLTSQTSSAFIRTLLCHAALIEDLLNENYDYVLTSRFQSNDLERRFGQYRQMNGGRFLVGLKDANISENIMKIKSLLKEGMNIDDTVKERDNLYGVKTDLLLSSIEVVNCKPETTCLSQNSRVLNER